MGEMRGKTALVTGGDRGIGRATATALAKMGVNIAVNYRHNEAAAREVVEMLRAKGVKAAAIAADVADTKAAAGLVTETISQLGGLDILINNAGVNRDSLLVRMREEAWDEVIAVNLKGAFNCLQAAAKVMLKQRFGVIINISSVVGVSGNLGQANYSAAKAGIIGLTKTAARELAPRGIRVNAVAPGFIETDMTKNMPDNRKRAVAERIPLGRFGAAGEVAALIAFLASDQANYITGQVIVIDGGLTI